MFSVPLIVPVSSKLIFPYIFFFFFLLQTAAYGILVPHLGIEPAYPALQGRFLTTGPPEKSLSFYLGLSLSYYRYSINMWAFLVVHLCFRQDEAGEMLNMN